MFKLALVCLSLSSLVACSAPVGSEETTTESKPRAPLLALENVESLAVGGMHTCARTKDGLVWCWGLNDKGQLGDGTTVDHRTPTRVAGIEGATMIAAGESHTCALRADQTVKCWGDDKFGQLGGANAEIAGIVSIAAGFGSSCALRNDAKVICWGAQEMDPHGMMNNPRIAKPHEVVGLDHVVAISFGGFHACALRDNGTASCWGSNYFGQLGDGSTTKSETPVDVIGLSDATKIASGTHHTCATSRDGQVRCWGANLLGQLALDWQHSMKGYVAQPTLMPALSGVAQVEAGGDHTCVLLAGYRAPRCWGYNDVGQVSTGGDMIVKTPLIPKGIATETVRAIVTGPLHSCALLDDSRVTCWGDDTHGQLGG